MFFLYEIMLFFGVSLRQTQEDSTSLDGNPRSIGANPLNTAVHAEFHTALIRREQFDPELIYLPQMGVANPWSPVDVLDVSIQLSAGELAVPDVQLT